MTIIENLPIEKKLEILSDAAKYDVACTSSGVERKGREGSMGNTAACGICHSFAADGRCISLLKILYTNECVYDCKYCINRKSNDTVRTSFTSEEICELTMQFYRRNYIEGLFLSSGVRHNPTETMEQIYIALRMLREKRHFNGYIHVKAVPGAAPELIAAVGLLADRMSTNLELPTAEGLKKLAPNKTRDTILKPMRQIQIGISENRYHGAQSVSRLIGTDGNRWGFELPDPDRGLNRTGRSGQLSEADGSGKNGAAKKTEILLPRKQSGKTDLAIGESGKSDLAIREPGKQFVPAGQSTQMIIGATPENDYQIMAVAEALYRKFDLKRVFYSAYIALNEDSMLPQVGSKPPLLREHRLYQADWLLRFYGFQADELLSPEKPNFNVYLDPKCEWALRHLEYFPMEINRVPYDMLLRIPGIGVKSARRIVQARRSTKLDFEHLKRIGVVLKRAHYFITCNGKMMYATKIDEDYITRQILDLDRKKNWELEYHTTFRQLSLFDDQSPLALAMAK